MPYFFIIFSYVMIVRKYNQSRSKVLQNSASGRSKAGGKFCLVETSFFTKRCPPAYTSSTVSTAGARSRRASEDEISMCEVTQVELSTILCEVSQWGPSTCQKPIRAFSIKNLSRHYAKQTLKHGK